MLDVLDQVLAELPALLRDGGWQSKLIDYHPPKVERVWRQHGDYRILLHRIHPCEAPKVGDPRADRHWVVPRQEGKALWHPHNWPAAMLVVSGLYEMGIGEGPDGSTARIAGVVRLTAGSRYEMTNPWAWHYVRPIGRPSMSVMVTGPLYEGGLDAPSTNDYPFPELSDHAVEVMLELFAALLGDT